MKITIVGPAYPLRGGIAQHVYLLHKHLTNRGHLLQVISYRRLYPAFLFPGRSTVDPSAANLATDAIQVIDTLNPVTWIQAYREIRGFGPDLTLFQWWNPITGPATGILVRLLKHANLNCVVECHNVFPHEPGPLDLPLTGFAFSPVNRFIVHSLSDHKTLLEQFPDKLVRVAPLPPPTGIVERSSAKRHGRNILFFGIVRRYKGLDVLLAAMPKVLSQVNGCRLFIVGEFYERESRYRDLIRQLNITDHVEIDNRYIPNEEIPEVFDRADVLVLPYLSATQSAVARLAARSALPMIASDTGGLSEAVRHNHNGLLVPPGDSGALAAALVSYFNKGLGPVFTENMSINEIDSEDIRVIATIEQFATMQSSYARG